MHIKHDSFTHDFYIHMLPAREWTEELIWTNFENICQSRKNDPNFDIKSDHKIEIKLDIFDRITGGSSKSKKRKREQTKKKNICLKDVTSFTEYKIAKNSIITFDNNDNHCLLRAILIGKWLLDLNIDLSKYDMEYLLDSETNKLANILGFSNTPSGIQNLKEIEDYYSEYQITLYHYNLKIQKEPIYLNKSRNFSKFIYIIYEEKKRHFSVVRSMTGFLNKAYFCHFCKIGYNNDRDHKCENVCKGCQKPFCKKNSFYNEKCNHCDIILNNETCKIKHFSICYEKNRCPDCLYVMYRKKHVCGEHQKWCKNCDKSVELNHICFIQGELENEKKKKVTKNEKFQGFVFFDFECFENKSKKHEVNLAIAQRINTCCLNILIENDRCENCKKIYQFSNIEDFGQWSIKQKNTIQIAHNLKAYDGHFILQFLLHSMLPTDQKPNVILNGSKLLSISFRDIKYKDSHCFISQPLSAFPKTFDLNELKKGLHFLIFFCIISYI